MHANGIWPSRGVSETLQEEKPKAGTPTANEALVGGSQKGVKAQKPIAHIPQIFCRSSLCSHVPFLASGRRSARRKSIGRRRSATTARGPDRSEMTDHPPAGTNLRRADLKPQERRRAIREGRFARPGRDSLSQPVAEHRAKERDGA